MKIVIAGAGEVGSHLAKMLSQSSNEITVIDPDGERLGKLEAVADVMTVKGNPTSVKVLKEAGTETADLFIAVNPSGHQEVNIVCAMVAKHLGAKRVSARVNEEEYLSAENKVMFKQMGLDFILYPEMSAADEIVDLLKHTATIDSMDFARGKLQISVFRLEEDSPILEMKLVEFAALVQNDNLQMRVIAVSRGSETIIPRPDFRFTYHDLVYIITTREGYEPLLKILGKNNIEVNKVMIIGGGQIGRMTAMQLSHKIDTVKLIDRDREKCIEIAEKLDDKIQGVCGDGRNIEFILDEGLKTYDAFIATTESDEANVLACVVAKKFGVEKTVAQVENIEYISLAEEMGVDAIINKKLITASRIFKYTLSGRARTVRYMSGTTAEALEYTVAKDSAITKEPLKEIDFPRGAVVGGVIRGSHSFIAVGDTRIEPYDRVAVFAMPESVKDIDALFR